jgi:hypothetical protein
VSSAALTSPWIFASARKGSPSPRVEREAA